MIVNSLISSRYAQFCKIEEALKLYQNALRYHAQGPEYYDQASQAYEELFRSEIFSYVESLSESQYLDRFGHTDPPDEGIEEDLTAQLPQLANTGEGISSTLPQILYLAYKNHGQFRLDRLKHQLDRIEQGLNDDPLAKAPRKATSSAAAEGLRDLAEALERDESDLELWRKVARVGDFLGSRRIARFSLETVLNTDGIDPDTEIEPLSIEEILANEQIVPLLESIDPEVARRAFSQGKERPRTLRKSLQRNIDPCPHLTSSGFSTLAQLHTSPASNQIIRIPEKTWTSCGRALLFQQKQEEQGNLSMLPGASYSLELPRQLPDDEPTPDDRVSVKENEPIIAESDESQGKPTLRCNLPNNAVEPKTADEISNSTTASPTKQVESPSVTVAEAANLSQTNDNITVLSLEAHSNVPLTHPVENQIQTPTVGTVTLPTRKRSSETAELPEGGDTGRIRSKRIKARVSTTDPSSLKDTTAEDWTEWYHEQLQIYVKADRSALDFARKVMMDLGCRLSSASDEGELVKDDTVGQQSYPGQAGSTTSAQAARRDMSNLLDTWDYQKSKILLNSESSKNPIPELDMLNKASFTAFLTQSAAPSSETPKYETLPVALELDEFVQLVNDQDWIPLGKVALMWISNLLGHQSLGTAEHQGPYESYLWPEDLKQIVVQILVNQDGYLYQEISQQIQSDDFAGPKIDTLAWQRLAALVQIIHELHLDVYGRITNPSSKVDIPTRQAQSDRLARWALLANVVASHLTSSRFVGDDCQWARNLQYRFLWASIVSHNLLKPTMVEITVQYLQDFIQRVQRETKESQEQPLELFIANNAIMPEISIKAAEREISRLTTLDFFTSIFSSADSNPTAVIESLGPLLSISARKSLDSSALENNKANSEGDDQQTSTEVSDPRLIEALLFLERASTTLRLFLWQRLQDAYGVINYSPEILSCNLWCFMLIVQHLDSEEYISSSSSTRQNSLLRWLHRLDEMMMQILALASTDGTAFETVDYVQIQMFLEATVSLQRIVHVFAVWEDTIRVGQTLPTPQPTNAATKAQLKCAEKLREMLVKIWILQYLTMKEARTQNQHIDLSNEDLIKFLRLAHESLGLRAYCGLAGKSLLKLIKAELLNMTETEAWQTEMSQIIFDLHGLKITSNVADAQDHGCETVEIDKRTTLEILDLVLVHVNRLTVKELLKHDLRFAVEKMQKVIKIPKAMGNSARTFNKRLINNYLKSPINPVEIYQCLRGISELCSTPAHTEGWDIAAKGWFFLLGHLYLVKFRSQKRVVPGSVEDLEFAKSLFKQDLEFETERWESWYRLAQAYDSQIDESVTWSAEKIQNDMSNLVDLQRKSILNYSMAIAVAKRDLVPSFENASKMTSLYADFGARIYSSTREPFSMNVFNVDDFKKKYNGMTRGMYESTPFKPMSLYGAWKLASALLGQASRRKPQDW